MWTLTQTDDNVWYHVYKNQDRQEEQRVRKRRADDSLQEQSKPEKRFKLALKEEEELVAVTVDQDTEEENMLRDYFQLNVKLADLYREWGTADPHFKRIANIFSGQCLFDLVAFYVAMSKLIFDLGNLSEIHCFVSCQVCGCCARTPLNACFPSFALPTTISLVSRAWWRGCARLWARHCASWIKLITMTFLHFLLLQVCLFLSSVCFLVCLYILWEIPVIGTGLTTVSGQLFIHQYHVFFQKSSVIRISPC